MIKIRYTKKDSYINYIKINGHANYAEEGFDIVCASVSSIAITTVNTLIKLDKDSINYIEKDGLLEINILKHDKTIDIIVENMISMLKELEKQYKDYIEIK